MQAVKIAVLSFVMFSTVNVVLTSASTSSELAKYSAAYTAANCPDPADYFSDSSCLDFFCGYFGVCTGTFSTPSSSSYEYFCASSSYSNDESKLRCANDLFLLYEVAATVSSDCTNLLDLTKYACTYDSSNVKYCDLAPYLGTVSGDVCTGTLSCCNFEFNDQTAIKSACYPDSTGSSDLSTLSYKCNNPFYFDFTDLISSGPSRIQEFCPEIYDYENNVIKNYEYFEADCEDYVVDFIAGLTDILTTSQKYDKASSAPQSACTKCSKDLKAIGKLATASSDVTCAVLSSGITNGCAYDSYTSSYCVQYDMYPSGCDKTKYSCCRAELTDFVSSYTSNVLTDTEESAVSTYYAITQFSTCTDSGLQSAIASISSVCTEKVDITEAAVKFCPALIDNDTKKLFDEASGNFTTACWSDIQSFFKNVGTTSLSTSSLCGSCSDDLAVLSTLFKAQSDASCGVVAALADFTCYQDYASSDDFYCGSFDVISKSSECTSVTSSSCCQDAMSEVIADAVSGLTDAQKIALDGLLYVPTYKTICGSGMFTVDVEDCSLPLDFCPELLDSDLNILSTISISTACESTVRSLFNKLGSGSSDAASICGTCKTEVDRIVALVASSSDETCLGVSALVDWACTVDTADNTYCGAYNIVDSLSECAGASCCQSELIADIAAAEPSMNEAQKAALEKFGSIASVDSICGTGFSTTSGIADSQCRSPDENAAFKPSFTFITVLIAGALMMMLL